jgi:hypothetical protein
MVRKSGHLDEIADLKVEGLTWFLIKLLEEQSNSTALNQFQGIRLLSSFTVCKWAYKEP